MFSGDAEAARGRHIAGQGWLAQATCESSIGARCGRGVLLSRAGWMVRKSNREKPGSSAHVGARAGVRRGGKRGYHFMDLAVQRVVKAYVATLPNEEQPVEEWFQSPTKKDTTIRHAWGHATHFHVRFRDPDAEALGERIKGMLPRIRKVKPRKP